MDRGCVALLAALSLALGAGPSAAATHPGSAAACAGGTFLLEAPIALPGHDEPVATIAIRDRFAVALAGCGEVRGHTTRARRQRWLRARWRCAGAGAVRLRAVVVGDGCSGLAGTLTVARGKPAPLAAVRLPAVAGRWVFSGLNTMSCSSRFYGGCGPSGASPPVTTFVTVTPVTATLTIGQEGQVLSATLSPVTYLPDAPFTGGFTSADSFTLTRYPSTGTSATERETVSVSGLHEGTAMAHMSFLTDYRHAQVYSEWVGTLRAE